MPGHDSRLAARTIQLPQRSTLGGFSTMRGRQILADRWIIPHRPDPQECRRVRAARRLALALMVGSGTFTLAALYALWAVLFQA